MIQKPSFGPRLQIEPIVLQIDLPGIRAGREVDQHQLYWIHQLSTLPPGCPKLLRVAADEPLDLFRRYQVHRLDEHLGLARPAATGQVVEREVCSVCAVSQLGLVLVCKTDARILRESNLQSISTVSPSRELTCQKQKINISIGAISFQAEGEQDWVAAQLDKLFAIAKDLVSVAPIPDSVANAGQHTPMGSDPDIATKPLATFLKDKNATSKQVQKFLATAVWLESKGQDRVATSDVAKALKDSNQARLGNPADCLNQNVKKRYCKKDGDKFFVTTDGRESL